MVLTSLRGSGGSPRKIREALVLNLPSILEVETKSFV